MKMKMKYKTLKLKTNIDDDETLRIDPENNIDIRAIGTLKDCALYLPGRFDWILGKDSLGVVCVVPLQKEEDIEEKRSEQLEKIIFALAESNIDRSVCDDIIERLEKHESTQLQEAAKHPWGHGR
jgi:hypothetical protein